MARIMAAAGSVEYQGSGRAKLPLVLAVAACSFALYFFANPRPQTHYDYTTQMALCLLEGRLGLQEQPPVWLNEFVPFEDRWYSVFPLGSVITMMPFAVLQKAMGWPTIAANWPAAISAALAGVFLALISLRYRLPHWKRALYCCAILAGSWMLPNLAFAGAWQLALGWAAMGMLGAIYFSRYRQAPVLAGFFFSLAFGNRTELLLLAPLFCLWLVQGSWRADWSACRERSRNGAGRSRLLALLSTVSGQRILGFCAIPILLGLATLLYNHLRFGSVLDFGYARIPGVLEEPWYREGIFSLSYVGWNAQEMLWRFLKRIDDFPWYVPTGFGGAVWFFSPMVFLALRPGSADRMFSLSCRLAILVITFVLWTHGNPGGWQISYRYAIPLLPFGFLLILESARPDFQPVEFLLIFISVALSAAATYVFLWTTWMGS
jgi:hypothetical protein